MSGQNYYARYPPPSEAGMELSPVVTAPPQPDALPPGGWPPPNMIYPPGLECLTHLDYLVVNQKKELTEACKIKNEYRITDNNGDMMFYMAEEWGCCSRVCMTNYPEFNIYDKNSREVLRMVRSFNSCDGCCSSCLQFLEVYSEDTLLGSITQEWSFWGSKFYIRDASSQPVLMIIMVCRCSNDTIFKVKSIDEKHHVGVIRKVWRGFRREINHDMFSINFPRDLDVKIKALLLGATILIDFIHFENPRNRNH